ncbi:NAD(P)H-hydrate dehydratase [Luteolibacter luteus]|uniref:Bifunctional NAD(P)H-hydrate repair enzyme n=1 Tax=Luteolibacter luteus TaxID=2728835 RepID=A0A858RII5_9BACT|nr:NAD(P)H-hydrate dehydratase [Luteolibacter luteus]QJE97026.1 NAD(P)H-hydrate dehydratase [Luteolibacter luteus]
MSFVTGAAMRSLEEAAFARGVSAEALMDLAGEGIAERLIEQFSRPGSAIGYVGKGNNGGDALVALRHLREAGWRIAIRAAFPEEEWGELPRRKLRDLAIAPEIDVPRHKGSGPFLLLDGLLGIGAKGALRGPVAAMAEEMATLRQNHGAVVAAMDLPSGLDADTGSGEAVIADLTLPVGVAKMGIASPNGVLRCGRVVLVPLKDLPLPDDSFLKFFCPEAFPGLLEPRAHGFHKGDAGRAGILAGSPGMTGAAVICTSAALHAGAGLVTLHVEGDFPPHLLSAMPPEVMVRPSPDPVKEAFEARHDALVIGPGTGHASQHYHASLLEFLASDERPIILDADALNQIAKAGRLDLLKSNHVITPHPGEFARLAPELAGESAVTACGAFVQKHGCTLLLKGARTLVAKSGQAIRFNPTGHAGMASGGQGDALSGVIGTLLAQGAESTDAASLGAWLCGRAGERSLANGPIATASDTIRHLGGAIDDWRQRRR